MRKKQKKKQRRKERSSGSCREGQGKREEERERLVTRPEERRHRESADAPRSLREARAKKERSRNSEPPSFSRKSHRHVSDDSRRHASDETRSSGSRPASASRRGSESAARHQEEQSEARRRAVPEEPWENSNKEIQPDGEMTTLRKRRPSREEEAAPESKRRSNADRSRKQTSGQPDRKQKEKPESWTMKPGAADDVQKPPALAETKSSQSAGPEVQGADRRTETKRGPLTLPMAAPRVAFRIPKQGGAVRARPGWDAAAKKGPGSGRPPAGTADPQSAAFDRGGTGLRPAAAPSHFSTRQKPSGAPEALPEPSVRTNESSRSATAEHAGHSSPAGKRAEAADQEQEVQLVEKLYLARSSRQLQLNMVESYGELTGMDVDPPEEGAAVIISQQQRQQDLLVVLDTNVLLSHLDFVKKIRSHGLGALGFPTLLVPWVVLQELDTLKSGKLSKEVERQARPAVDYIYMCLKNQEPRLRGQSMQQASQAARGTNAANNDDRVLQCCLQYQELHPEGAIILCTNDKNLCSKALLSGVRALSKADLTEQVEINPGFLNHRSTTPAAYPHLTAPEEGWQAGGVKEPGEEERASRKKAAEAEQDLSECVSALESSLHAVLSAVLEEEMSAVFGELWTEIVYLKPPWTLAGILQCFRKHWIAVFGTIVRRSLLSNVETLSKFLCTDTSVDRSSVLKAVCAAEELLTALCSRSSYSGRINSSFSCIKALKHRLQAEAPKAPVEDGSDGDALMMEAVDVAPPPDSYQAVWDLFQNIWNNVCHVSLALFSAFNFSPDSAGPVQPFSAPPPQDALGCLYRLSAAVGQLLEAFHRLLSVNSSVEDAQALLSFLHSSAILPVEPSFSAKDLFECLSQEEYRDKLSVGGSQLMVLKSNLDRCAAAACGLNPACT